MPPVDTIPVVEDESLVRMSIAFDLEEVGFRVLEAPDADHAVELLERVSINTLFTDVGMPGSMDGLALAKYARHHFSMMLIIVASGHHEVAGDQLPCNSLFVTKPYQVEQVTMEIETLRLNREHLRSESRP